MFLNETGLRHFIEKIKNAIPKKVSELDNDSDFVDKASMEQTISELTGRIATLETELSSYRLFGVKLSEESESLMERNDKVE